MVYTDKEFINENMPDINKIDSSLLINYYNKHVINRDFIHVLSSGEVVHLTPEKENFFHLTGLGHSDKLLKSMYESITSQSSEGIDNVQLKHIVKGRVAYDHLMTTNYSFNDDNLCKFFVSRISRFNKLHSILKNPDFIVEVDAQTISKSAFAMKKGDLLFVSEKKSKVMALVVSKNMSDNTYFLKSYFVDRPQYCSFNHLLNDSNNLKLANITMAKKDALGYLKSVYGNMQYPYLDKIGYLLADDIKSLNKLSNRLLKFETIQKLHLEAIGSPTPNMKNRFEHQRQTLLKRICDGLDKAESLYLQDIHIENQRVENTEKNVENELS